MCQIGNLIWGHKLNFVQGENLRFSLAGLPVQVRRIVLSWKLHDLPIILVIVGLFLDVPFRNFKKLSTAVIHGINSLMKTIFIELRNIDGIGQVAGQFNSVICNMASINIIIRAKNIILLGLMKLLNSKKINIYTYFQDADLQSQKYIHGSERQRTPVELAIGGVRQDL